ncbi:MAG: hypothetical protein IT292_00055 [Deltaproteobacteria bacterium]|nr:hypothetical protein [Deltaproteobacteria bacterium]
MATYLFNWLEIELQGCLVDFYNEKETKNLSEDAAGFYSKFIDKEGVEREAILINSKLRRGD